jgi:lactate permease
MVKCMCSWKQTIEVWPALAVAGGSFALFQLTFATFHVYVPEVVLWPMTDIGGGIFSLIVTALFLNYWKPRNEWHYHADGTAAPVAAAPPARHAEGAHAAEAAALVGDTPADKPGEDTPLTAWSIALAWAPFALMSVFLLLTGLVRQAEPGNLSGEPIMIGPIQTNYLIPVPGLHGESIRDPRLLEPGKEGRGESALFNFAWLTAPGTAVFFAAIASMLMFRMNLAQVGRVLKRTCFQMKIPIPTIAVMLGLSYLTRYAGMDATLGVAFAETGWMYPFFAAMLGWLGVFLTGTDAGSNALFGSLQKITATEVFNSNPHLFEGQLTQQQAQVLISTANSTGGVMGKMIDAQSICVATAATHQIGKEADIFKAVIWHSVVLAAIVGLITLVQAYVYPFTQMVPASGP